MKDFPFYFLTLHLLRIRTHHRESLQMPRLVQRKPILPHESLATRFALIRTIGRIRMRQPMLLQRVLFRIRFAAHIALVPDTVMRVHVPIQMALLLVAVRAKLAFVWRLTGVRPTMQDQVRWSAEFLVAIRALDGFAGVQRHVGFERGVL